jgi:hypothetical protein
MDHHVWLIGQLCSVYGILSLHLHPKLWILRRLNSHPTILIVRHRHRADIVVQIVKHQVRILHTYDENQVMLSRR